MEILILAITIFTAFCTGYAVGEARTLKYVNSELRKINEPTTNNKR